MKRRRMYTVVPPDAAERIKAFRARHDLTQARFAALLGVAAPTVNRWEQGVATPSQDLWQRFAQAEHGGPEALSGGQPARPLGGANGVVREARTAFATPEGAEHARAPLSFTADPDDVRLAVEAHRLEYGYLVNPAFATEISLIEPLPHQRIAVYERMLHPGDGRLRFLLADDAGAGKTIMTGLYIREMLARRLIRRVLIVPPAGLVGNWRRELDTLFSLDFRIVSGADLREGNPFTGPESDQVIVSVDTLAGERLFGCLQGPDVAPYDLVVFDEAHKLAADREADLSLRRTDRYKLGEALAGVATDDDRWRLSWAATHLLLLTATPHMGKDFPYYALWRLLEPEALSTIEAFNNYPPEARREHFIRRTKEEMVFYDGRPIYPQRQCDTASYDLTPAEQDLYDAVTAYLQRFYNSAGILNRSAARLAMSVFQRRLASSTVAILRSLQRRRDRLSALIADIQAGRISEAQLRAQQQHELPFDADAYDVKTADEEVAVNGEEEHDRADTAVIEALSTIAARNLADLLLEREQVEQLAAQAQAVYDAGDESKFLKLREVLKDPSYAHEKFIIFTEHKDTLDFLVHRLEGLGYTEEIAQIHGGMDFEERERQVTRFRQPLAEGGARYLVATDAAGEGINLQFCWLMINYDIPWNPARLEQRMGRIHRFGQRHDPVIIVNLIAGKTREGRVMATLLEKLERIRRDMGADKVFDVIGRLFEGVSLREYMEQALTPEGERDSEAKITGKLTTEQVAALQERERRLYGDGGEVKAQLPRLRASLDEELYRHLMPGYVRHFVAQAAPRLALAVSGDLDGTFALRPEVAGAMDVLWPALSRYAPEQQRALTIARPADKDGVIFLHPGEPVFEALRAMVLDRVGPAAQAGAIFVDPAASRPYTLHVALLQVVRSADPTYRALSREETVEYQLVAIRQEEKGALSVCPVEQILLLGNGHGPTQAALPLIGTADEACERAHTYALETLTRQRAEARRDQLSATLPDRETFIRQGFRFQESELLQRRARYTQAARAGDPHAKAEVTRIREQQATLDARREEALAVLRREAELIAPGAVSFLAHAIVLPSDAPEDQRRQEAQVEQVAVTLARAYEEARGARVVDVSTGPQALRAGLPEFPGFDLLAYRPDGSKVNIEVKGRAGTGQVLMSENEYRQACNLEDNYWLYVAFDCATARPRLVRVQNPFRKLIAKVVGGVEIEAQSILENAES